ncbi:MAG: extensin family protein [Proteobacteria bacterium]|nr:extensin family protein [Pseudomonadota bacterium]
MSVVRIVSLLSLFGLAVLAGCAKSSVSSNFISKPEPWREKEENRCLALGIVRQSSFLVQRTSLGGPGYCGVEHPFDVSGLMGGRVTLKPAATLRCEMIPALEQWNKDVVQPVARRFYGLPVIEMKVLASFGCRPINHVGGARLSEHGHANAVDIGAFQLADGRWISVKAGWYGDPRERAFLRSIHDGGCQIFMTVLGPNFDGNHRDHFHLDLAWHGKQGQTKICR